MREVKRKFLSAMVKKVIQITPEAIATSDLSKYVNIYSSITYATLSWIFQDYNIQY